ncbi:hypothetical protein GCM10007301_22440 [Azorhizobium oxalatiphilum]|uniref:Tyramine--L-glutamate ligase pre ATP-grasp domain-containing protein n=1 Tax=Azorhizobium oxalatiphilum TaxID=980631 RepID=A0A917FBI4_9HYPH|nr:hypothetical protein [Azorhizobium oxalatiphilum]GGF62192.1 hypothetical protein GCM10007301_22440 [Azorhizobium oxalatiphilum]
MLLALRLMGDERRSMRVFLCEYLTAGGFRAAPLEALAPDRVRQALLLRDALARDLEAIPGVTVVLAHDDRLPAPETLSTAVPDGTDPWVIWTELARQANVVWPVALEPARLATMASSFRHLTPHVIAPSADALALTADPLRLSSLLARAGVPVADTRGAPASLSVLARPDGTTLLGVNIPDLAADGSARAITVGARPDTNGALAALAAAVVEAVPGLLGLVDIHIRLQPGAATVTGIQPGPGLAYAGLHRSRGINPLAFLPALIREGRPPRMPHLPPPQPVTVCLSD